MPRNNLTAKERKAIESIKVDRAVKHAARNLAPRAFHLTPEDALRDALELLRDVADELAGFDEGPSVDAPLALIQNALEMMR